MINNSITHAKKVEVGEKYDTTNLFLTEYHYSKWYVRNLSIHYTWKNIRQYKNNKVKIIAPRYNDKFELPDVTYSMSDIQDYIIK